MLSASLILHKRSSVSGKVPALSSLEIGELAINTADGKIFTKSPAGNVYAFLNSSSAPYILNQSLSSVYVQYGNNGSVGAASSVLNGSNNNVVGSKSTILNGENNSVFSNFGLIANGSNNTISLTASQGAIIGGSENNLKHANSFILGSNISSHAENFTYVNNLSVGGSVEVRQISATELNVGTSNEADPVLFVGVNSRVGINTEIPDKTLTVHGDAKITGITTINNDIEITDPTKGIILRSPDNRRWRITINNNGQLAANSL